MTLSLLSRYTCLVFRRIVLRGQSCGENGDFYHHHTYGCYENCPLIEICIRGEVSQIRFDTPVNSLGLHVRRGGFLLLRFYFRVELDKK